MLSRPILVRSPCCRFLVELPTYSTVQEADTIHVRELCELDHQRIIDDMYISDLLSIE